MLQVAYISDVDFYITISGGADAYRNTACPGLTS